VSYLIYYKNSTKIRERFSGIENTKVKSSSETLLAFIRTFATAKTLIPSISHANHLSLDEMMSSFCTSFTLFLVSRRLSHKFTYKAMEIYLKFHKHLFSVVFLLVAYAYLRVLHHVHTKMYFH